MPETSALVRAHARLQDPAVRRYLDLLKRCLTREVFIDQEVLDVLPTPEQRKAIEGTSLRLVRRNRPGGRRVEGRDYPPSAETMVGVARLDNVEELVAAVVTSGTPGDLVETGVWRGGTVILMRAVLEMLGDTERRVWACDSFAGLPEPNLERYPDDAAMAIPRVGKELMDALLVVSVAEVKTNFERYGLLDDRVRFLEGWFADTLPTAPIEEIAVLRLDGDFYESTMDSLVHLEPRVADGGFVIVDDYSSIEACRTAVDEYRRSRGITAPITEIDWTGVWWQVSRTTQG